MTADNEHTPSKRQSIDRIQSVIRATTPIYLDEPSGWKLLDAERTNEKLLAALRTHDIPIVENATMIRWHFSERQTTPEEIEAANAVTRLASAGNLMPLINRYDRHAIRYIYWQSDIYTQFPFGAIINGHVCCATDETMRILKNCVGDKLYLFTRPKNSLWQQTPDEHLLIVSSR